MGAVSSGTNYQFALTQPDVGGCGDDTQLRKPLALILIDEIGGNCGGDVAEDRERVDCQQ